jgi:hypothetical protein
MSAPGWHNVRVGRNGDDLDGMSQRVRIDRQRSALAIRQSETYMLARIAACGTAIMACVALASFVGEAPVTAVVSSFASVLGCAATALVGAAGWLLGEDLRELQRKSLEQ